jgi:hypothetical protein
VCFAPLQRSGAQRIAFAMARPDNTDSMTSPRRDDERALISKRVHYSPQSLSFWSVDNVALFLWHESITLEVAAGLAELTEPMRERYPTGMSIVHMGNLQIAKLDPATRAELARHRERNRRYVAATAVVSLRGGFWASALRSVITGMFVLAKTENEIRINASTEEVLAWLPDANERKTGVAVDREELRRVLTHAEATIRRNER